MGEASYEARKRPLESDLFEQIEVRVRRTVCPRHGCGWLVAPGYVNHNPFVEPGPEGVKKVFGAIIAGVRDFPNLCPPTQR